ncbi:hypothetical protein M1N79_03885, partial [Dehalococcoidia bacterium]|nr:hypothetical protein [Dehalococcoidia bacterium]
MLDWGNYITVASNGQSGKLTYTKPRGYHHWTCLKCHKRERERIPDQADSAYCHNPGNPIMAVCDNCNHGIGTGRIKPKPKRSKRRPPRESRDSESPLAYNQLNGDWGQFCQVAERFQHKAIYQDREDLKHNIMLCLAEVHANNGHKPTSQALMHRIAAKEVADYWRGHYRHTNGLDCGGCGKAQRKECKKSDLYSSCPKAIRVESLSKPITDQDGNITELGRLIADDRAIDVADWVEVNTWRLGYPGRLVEIADKIRRGEALSGSDHVYLT